MSNKAKLAIIILAVLTALVSLFLGACGQDETEEFIYWATLWAQAHEIMDENDKPNYGNVMRFVAGQAFGLGSTGDEEADAAIDCARVLDRIRQAEESAGSAWKALEAGENIHAGVLPYFNRAVDSRPEDWSYHNARAAANLEDLENPDGAKAAREDFAKADSLAEKSGSPEEYLRMLRDRAQALARLAAINSERHVYPVKENLEEQARTCDELYRLTGETGYLISKEKAESNLQKGRFRERTPGQ